MSTHGSAANVGLSAYGLAHFGSAYLSAIAYGGGGTGTVNRSLAGLGFDAARSASFDSYSLAGRFETGYQLRLNDDNLTVTPFIALQPMQVWQSGSADNQGEGVRFAAAQIPSLPLYLGAQVDGKVRFGETASISPFLRAAWVHDFLPDRLVSRSFTDLPGKSFDASGITPVVDAAILRAGLRYAISPSLSLAASLDSELSSRYRTIGATGQIQVAW